MFGYIQNKNEYYLFLHTKRSLKHYLQIEKALSFHGKASILSILIEHHTVRPGKSDSTILQYINVDMSENIKFHIGKA